MSRITGLQITAILKGCVIILAIHVADQMLKMFFCMRKCESVKSYKNLK